MKHNRFLISLLLVSLTLIVVLIVFVDKPLSQELRVIEAQYPALIDFFRDSTDLGKSKWYLWPSGIGVIALSLCLHLNMFSKRLRTKLKAVGEKLFFFFICVAASGILTDVLKRLFGRTRPVKLDQEGIYGFFPLSFGEARFHSMPSGHATTGFALAFALAVLFPRGRWLFIALGIFLAISRVMVNAHFLSDILGGCLIAYLTVKAIRPPNAYNGMYPAYDSIFPIDRKAARK